jgi:hypothetical protein
VARFINEHFIPVKLHVKEQPAAFGRFGAQWTPTLIILTPSGQEAYRFEGYLPADDFLAQLTLGLGHTEFKQNRFGEAEKYFREVVERHRDSDSAPEALYWAGVSRYKGSNDAAALKQTADAFRSQYSDSSWAKKASVWAA